MPLEREIKLRFDTADEARARVLALGATPFKGRRLQEDCLLDDDRQSLKNRQCIIRVRSEGGKGLLTFKGPPQPGPMKLREERETVVADGDMLLAILSELGLRVWFRYEKYREEFHVADVTIAVDETPLGAFVEIEGDEAHIHDVARALGRAPTDYITESYRTLFFKHRDASGIAGNDMVFAAHS